MSTAVITVSGRGQIVIPREIRKRLRIVSGTKLTIKVEGDSAVMTPLPDGPAEQFCGIFREGTSLTEALVDRRRKDRDEEEDAGYLRKWSVICVYPRRLNGETRMAPEGRHNVVMTIILPPPPKSKFLSPFITSFLPPFDPESSAQHPG